jgi:hypothetical protein
MTIPEVPDGTTLPYYELVRPQLPDRDIQDGGEDLKSVFYTHTDGDAEIGTMRRRTHRMSTGEKAPVAEELARVSVATRLLLELGMKDGSAITDRAKEIAAQQWMDCDMVLDGELVNAQKWQQDGWSVVMYLTPTLIIYAILPDDSMTGAMQLAQLIT